MNMQRRDYVVIRNGSYLKGDFRTLTHLLADAGKFSHRVAYSLAQSCETTYCLHVSEAPHFSPGYEQISTKGVVPEIQLEIEGAFHV